MNENMSKRKDWIKNAAIVFLIVLLILTFFSNTIMNYSLPQVATQYVSSGSITTKIRGSGTVESVDPYSVILGDENSTATTRKISKLLVQVGDTVEKGDILLYLDERENSALEEAQKAVEDAQAAYEAALLSDGVNNTVISSATGSFNATDYSNQIIAAQNEVDAQQQVVDELQDTIDAFTLQISISGSDSQNNDVANAQRAVNNAQKALEDAKAKVAAAKVAQEKAQAAYEDALEAQADAQTAYDAAETAYNTAVAEGKSQEELDALKKTLVNAQTTLTVAEAKQQEAKDKKDDADKEVKNAEEACVKAQQEADVKIPAAEAALAKAKIDQQNTLLNLNQQLAGYQVKKNEADKLLAEKQEALNNLKNNKNAIISLKDAKEALVDAKEKLEEVMAEEIDSAVVSEINGTVTSIAYKSGQTVTTGETLMVLQPAGQGYTMSVSVTNEQAKRVSIGDTAELVNNWWYDDINVVLKSIRPDSSDPSKKKLLVFSLDGDVTEGQNLTVSIGNKSANYELIVPNSAIREDSNGKFILIVQSKSSPLGNRYIATRVDVDVLASDDTQSAVSGALNGWEFVITTSTLPITAGQQVRLAEN